MNNLNFKDRINLTDNLITKKLLSIIIEKKTNLCYSADINNKFKLIDLVEKIGDHICVLKIHCDIIEEFDHDFSNKLIQLSKLLNFLIIEDRKFCDIGKTFIDQYTKGVFKIKDWSDLITVNCLSGEGILQSFHKLNIKQDKSMLLIYDLSCKNLIDSNYKNKVTSYLRDISYKNDILGVITQKNEINDPKVLYFTPGVNLSCKTDQNDQNYRSPEDAIKRDNCDIIIVGRGISYADDPIKTAILYKNLSWNAYLEKLSL